jgi:hypothetical protein
MDITTFIIRVYVNRRKLFNNHKSNNRRFTQGFAVFNLGFVKLFTAKHILRGGRFYKGGTVASARARADRER